MSDTAREAAERLRLGTEVNPPGASAFWDDIRTLLASREALEAFVTALEPNVAERAEVLAHPEYWAKEYQHAYSKWGEVMDLDQRAKAAEAQRDALAKALREMNALIPAIMDALESDDDLEARRRAFESIQDAYEPTHSWGAALAALEGDKS